MARSSSTEPPNTTCVPRLCGDGPERLARLISELQRSPPVRGWPVFTPFDCASFEAFPACAGMARLKSSWMGAWKSVPRLCGDGPAPLETYRDTAVRSPPVRGWPENLSTPGVANAAFPACAGMARPGTSGQATAMGVPRLCGDGPQLEAYACGILERYPPVRGWPEQNGVGIDEVLAFPACAGMARSRKASRIWARCVPRLCGDGPSLRPCVLGSPRRSPPVRGWPELIIVVRSRRLAFPACAGMARAWRSTNEDAVRVPRLCGDGPY